MKLINTSLLLTLISGFYLTSANANPDIVAGHKWEFNRYDTKNVIAVVVQVDLTVPGTMIANVTCAHQGEIIKPSTSGPVQITALEIINNTPSRDVAYFSTPGLWCSAEIPVRYMSYTVIDEEHLLVSGDPFFPDNTIWTRVY